MIFLNENYCFVDQEPRHHMVSPGLLERVKYLKKYSRVFNVLLQTITIFLWSVSDPC